MQGIKQIVSDMKGLLGLMLMALNYHAIASIQQRMDKSLLKSLEDSFNRHFIETWPFKRRFPKFENLQIGIDDAKQGIDVDGGWSKHTMRLLLKKALQGEDIRVLILGSSISVGADLGCRNYRRTFHYGFSYWWNQTIGAVTDSKLLIHPITVGGSGTAYFGHCWKEYLRKQEHIDLVIWELAHNDQMIEGYSTSLERLIRSIVEYWSRPGLLFINFFRKNFFTDYLISPPSSPCQGNELHETIIKNMARYYAVTSLSLEKAICNKLASNKSDLTMRDLFNGKHPSSLAHAQMTFMLTHYTRTSLLSFLGLLQVEASHKNLTYILNEKEPSLSLPEPVSLHESEIGVPSICWTEVIADYRTKLKHPLFKLPVIVNKGFSKILKTDWKDADEIRYDSVGGYLAFRKGRILALELTIKPERPSRNVTVSVGVRNKYFGGQVKFSLYSASTTHRVNKLYVDTASRELSGLNVYDLAAVPSGIYVFVVKTLTGGVLLSSIILT